MPNQANVIDEVLNHTLELMTAEKQEETRNLYIQRNKYNKKILTILNKYVKQHPQFRFIQALHALTICGQIDRFHEESKATYERISKILEQQKQMQEKLQESEEVDERDTDS